VNGLAVAIVVGVIVALALFGFFLRRVSKEQGSVEKLSREIDSMERQQRIKERQRWKSFARKTAHHDGERCSQGRSGSRFQRGNRAAFLEIHGTACRV
jgi:MFS superfamily sulfate permease-like transporter